MTTMTADRSVMDEVADVQKADRADAEALVRQVIWADVLGVKLPRDVLLQVPDAMKALDINQAQVKKWVGTLTKSYVPSVRGAKSIPDPKVRAAEVVELHEAEKEALKAYNAAKGRASEARWKQRSDNQTINFIRNVAPRQVRIAFVDGRVPEQFTRQLEKATK